MTLFNTLIFLGVLFAMLTSSKPRQIAIAACLGVSLFGILINMFVSVQMVYPLAGIMETAVAIALVRDGSQFCKLMAGFLLASAILNCLFIPVYLHTDLLTYGAYTSAFHTVAVLHVIAMLIYSNGSVAIIRGFRSLVSRDNASSSGLRQRGSSS